MKRTLLFILLAALTSARAAERLSFVFILIDDMGATDATCCGSKFYETPNIDRMAREGVRFTQAYSACTVCSPTRASLLTGQYPARLHLTDWIAGHVNPAAKLRVPDWTMSLTHDVTTLPQALKGAGYTTACMGKWHVGEDGPEKYGFDVAIANNGKGQPASYFSPYKNPNLPDGPPGEFLTDRLTTEAEKFIEQNKDRPFFLYLPHYAVHQPIAGKPEVVSRYRAKRDASYPQHNAVYAALVESVDDSLGRIRAKLDELKIADRTVVIFTSDNGGLTLGQTTSNLGLRAGKGSAYEGGVRVPAIALVPGVTKAGTENATPVITPDWFATILAMARVPAPKQLAGMDLAPLLRGGSLAERAIFWHYPHYHPGGATPYSAVREGDWKLIEFFEDDHVELFNLREDPAEAHEISAAQPERTAALRAKLHAWRVAEGAQLPTPNPNYDPAKAGGGKREAEQ
jgi:arylsulfatase A-like enzyme